jgi:hypothetical protein
MKRVNLLIVVTLLILSSCTKNEDLNTNYQSKASIRENQYLDVEIPFREIFFHQANAGQKLPFLHSKCTELNLFLISNPNYQSTYNSMVNEIINNVYMINSNFFTEFNTGIASDNLNIIKKTMENTSAILQQALLFSEKFKSVSVLGEFISNNKELKESISKLDLKSESGIKELQNIISKNKDLNNLIDVNNYSMVYALAVAWTIGAIVATLAVVMNMAVKMTVVAWDAVAVYARPTDGNSYTINDLLIAEISNSY